MYGITVEEIFTEGDNPVEYGREEREESGFAYSTTSSGF